MLINQALYKLTIVTVLHCTIYTESCVAIAVPPPPVLRDVLFGDLGLYFTKYKQYLHVIILGINYFQIDK